MTTSIAGLHRGRWPLLIPLLALLYAPFVGGGLLTDDFVHLGRISTLTNFASVVAQPDGFRFYRPVSQASLWIERAVHGDHAAGFRAVSLVLHAGVLALAFVVARHVLGSGFGAALAALAFALTPKAPPIAVLWISARAEILMAIFSFAAITAWMRWSRGGGRRWLAASAAAYLLAALSKETAFLLPLVCLVTPRAQLALRTRFGAVAMLLAFGAVAFVWRAQVGGLPPFSGDGHYDLLTGVARAARGLRNYSGRMIAAPLLLVGLAALARVVSRMRGGPERPPGVVVAHLVDWQVVTFSFAWILILLAPTLPIIARSELYLYMPVFGVCLLAASVAAALMEGLHERAIVAVLVVYIAALGGYQTSRSAAVQRDLDFSAKLVEALRGDAALAAGADSIALVPADAVTERFLQDSIGGYLYAALQRAFPDGHVTGVVLYAGMETPPDVRRIVCRYWQGAVTLTHQGE